GGCGTGSDCQGDAGEIARVYCERFGGLRVIERAAADATRRLSCLFAFCVLHSELITSASLRQQLRARVWRSAAICICTLLLSTSISRAANRIEAARNVMTE